MTPYEKFILEKLRSEYADYPEILKTITDKHKLKYFMDNLYGKPIDEIRNIICLNSVC